MKGGRVALLGIILLAASALLIGVWSNAAQSEALVKGDAHTLAGEAGNIEVTGRMTGGGSVFLDEERVTHGFELHCDRADEPNNLEVNWLDNQFYLEELGTVTCTNDLAIVPDPPTADFDTYEGTGTGRLNGVPATAHWIFTDAGEPGRNDTAQIDVFDADANPVLSVAGSLNRGDQQAHGAGGGGPGPAETGTPTPRVTNEPTSTPPPPTSTPGLTTPTPPRTNTPLPTSTPVPPGSLCGKIGPGLWKCAPADANFEFNRIDIHVGKATNDQKLAGVSFLCQSTGEKVPGQFKLTLLFVDPDSPLPHHEIWSGDFATPCARGVTISLQLVDPGNNPIIVDVSFSVTGVGNGLDFSLGVDVNGDAIDDCNTKVRIPAECSIPAGNTFTLNIYLNSLPDTATSYEAFDISLRYAGVNSKDNVDASHWPDCVFAATFYVPGVVAFGCTIGIAVPASSYLGLIGTNDFNCVESGQISLVHGESETVLWETQGEMHIEGEGLIERLPITCEGGVAALALDTDADGCTDERERGPDPARGGGRDPHNPWDYFNPSRDRLNRVDDVLAVLGQYRIDRGQASYTERTDRTFVGPDPWNLGPPDGQQRIDDILAVVKQYSHDCV